MRVLAVDPGARWTAAVVRDGERLISWETMTRDDHELGGWLAQVTATLGALAERTGPDLVAIEAVVEPTPHMGTISVRALFDTCAVIGALWVTLEEALLVPPGKFGAPLEDGYPPTVARRILLARYPAELVGPRETTGGGKGPNQHLRAAWDLAGVAPAHARRAQQQ